MLLHCCIQSTNRIPADLSSTNPVPNSAVCDNSDVKKFQGSDLRKILSLHSSKHNPQVTDNKECGLVFILCTAMACYITICVTSSWSILKYYTKMIQMLKRSTKNITVINQCFYHAHFM